MKSVPGFFVLFFLFFTLNVYTSEVDGRAVDFLNRAINSLGRGDYRDAIEYSRNASLISPELGDAWYSEALGLISVKQPVYEILGALEKALSCDYWMFYNKNNCLGQYCRYLAVTTDYESVLKLTESFTLENATADILLARMMALYGLGRIGEGREIFRLSLERFPFDTRFSEVFFNREKETVLTSKDADLMNLAEEALAKVDLQSGALDFTNGKFLLSSVYFIPSADERVRLLKACSANGVVTPEGTLEMLRYGVISGDKALEFFKLFAEQGISLDTFLEIPGLLKPGKEISLYNEFVSKYSGCILRDDNRDGFYDSKITYKNGSPLKIEHDKNQDGLKDWVLNCNEGTPVSVQIDKRSLNGVYKKYPELEKVEAGNSTFLLMPNSLKWTPVSIKPYPVSGGILFYIPEINEFSNELTDQVLYSHSSVVMRPVADNPFCMEQLELVKGMPVGSVFSENNKPYAYGSYKNGFLTTMKIDMDRDGSFEAFELYEPEFSSGLSKLKTFYIDKNRDGNFEYREDYGDINRIRWDYDDDGVVDSEYKIFKDGREQTVIRHPVTGENCEIISQKGVPLSVSFNGKVSSISSGKIENFFWIGNVPADNEELIAKKTVESYNLSHGLVVSDLVKVENLLILVVKTGENYYAQIIGE